MFRAMLVCVVCGIFSWQSMAQTISLVGTPYATFVDAKQHPTRYTDVVETAFTRLNTPVAFEIMRRAFMGSALLSGKVHGEISHFALNLPDGDYLYSQPYTAIDLYLASRSESVTQIQNFSYIANERVAIENRFANTDQLRPISEVRWSRNPTAFDMFRQIADERAEYLLADKRLIEEFNKLLKANNRPQLFLSPKPIVTTSAHISLRKTFTDARQLIDQFDAEIATMQQEGVIEALMRGNKPSPEDTLLDKGLYQRMMQNW